MGTTTQPAIFLSHKSDDRKYGHALAELIRGLGVSNSQLIYTSHPLHKIPLNQNIYDYLRNRLGANTFMIYLLSDTYFESSTCLNEMGAAWLAQSDYTIIFVPGFNFYNQKFLECAIDNKKIGIVLNGDHHCKVNMIELRNKIQSLFNLDIDEAQWMMLLDKFITDSAKADSTKRKPTPLSSPKSVENTSNNILFGDDLIFMHYKYYSKVPITYNDLFTYVATWNELFSVMCLTLMTDGNFGSMRGAIQGYLHEKCPENYEFICNKYPNDDREWCSVHILSSTFDKIIVQFEALNLIKIVSGKDILNDTFETKPVLTEKGRQHLIDINYLR